MEDNSHLHLWGKFLFFPYSKRARSALLISFLQQTQVVSAKYVMKTDDDAFVRVDEVMTSLANLNVSRGLLYGLINSDSRPHRDPDSKWYISPEVSLSSSFSSLMV